MIFLKKVVKLKTMQKRCNMIEKKHQTLSISRQYHLLSIHHSGLYYQPKKTTKLNRILMRLIDEQYMNKPYYGIYRMWEWLVKDNGYKVNIKHIRRLYRLMGVEAIAPKPNASKPAPGHRGYSYLLKNLSITHSNML